jgi:beta-glucosidase
MDWEIHPEGLTDHLVRLGRDYPGLPLYITENGAAFDDPSPDGGELADPQRTAYLDAHLRAVAAAQAQGADVRGYFAWSLMDNFEWAEGYAKRFGLVHVDYATQRRTPKQSAHWYAATIARSRTRRL